MNNRWDFSSETVAAYIDLLALAGQCDDYALGPFTILTTMLRASDLYSPAVAIHDGRLRSDPGSADRKVPFLIDVPACRAITEVLDAEGPVGEILAQGGVRSLHELRAALAFDGLPGPERLCHAAVTAAFEAATTPVLRQAVLRYAGLTGAHVHASDLQAVADFIDKCVQRAGFELAEVEEGVSAAAA